MRPPPHRDLAFAHPLQQRSLGLRGCAVDLICQQQVRKDGPLPENKIPHAAAGLLLKDQRPCDVGGHQVRGKLDPAEVQGERLRDRIDKQGLGETGHSLQDRMPANQQGHQQLVNNGLLANDNPSHLFPEPAH